MAENELPMKKSYLLLLMLLMCASTAMAQDSTRHAFTVSASLGMYDGDFLSGEGVDFGIGYQRKIFNDRFRLHASANFGAYEENTKDGADLYFSSMDVKADINYDLIRYRSFSLIVGTGLMYEYTRGIIDPGVLIIQTEDYLIYLHRETTFFGKSNVGVNLLAGLRYNPSSEKYAIELLPLYTSVGLEENYYKLMAQMRMVYKL